MNNLSNILVLLLVVIVALGIYHAVTTTKEAMRGRRGHRGRHRHHNRRGHRDRGTYPRYWWNNRWRDYYYGVPYFTSYLPTWLSYRCRQGCAQLSDGTMGCVNPGYGPDSCLFASDCSGC